jgi:hypothetical protein
MANAWLYGATIDDDSWTIVPGSGHQAAWHVFITSGQGYVTVVMLSLRGVKG